MTKKEELEGELFSMPVVGVSGSYYGYEDTYREKAYESSLRLHFMPGGVVKWTNDSEVKTELVSELDEEYEDDE